MLLLTISILSTFAFMIPLMNTPITLGVWIFMMAMFTSLSISIISSTWFGLILFIIYIGGLLVMFSYFTATAPNQKMNLSSIFFLFILMFTLIFFWTKPVIQSWMTLNLSSLPNYINAFSYLFSMTQGILLTGLAILLFLALVFVVKITNRNMGPLRPFN